MNIPNLNHVRSIATAACSDDHSIFEVVGLPFVTAGWPAIHSCTDCECSASSTSSSGQPLKALTGTACLLVLANSFADHAQAEAALAQILSTAPLTVRAVLWCTNTATPGSCPIEARTLTGGTTSCHARLTAAGNRTSNDICAEAAVIRARGSSYTTDWHNCPLCARPLAAPAEDGSVLCPCCVTPFYPASTYSVGGEHRPLAFVSTSACASNTSAVWASDGSLADGKAAWCATSAANCGVPAATRSGRLRGRQTVLRAELTAVLEALRNTPSSVPIVIHTDCKPAIYNIWREAEQPTRSLRNSAAPCLARQIFMHLSDRRTATIIQWIKSHDLDNAPPRWRLAAELNAAADAGAKAATELPCPADEPLAGWHWVSRGQQCSSREFSRVRLGEEREAARAAAQQRHADPTHGFYNHLRAASRYHKASMESIWNRARGSLRKTAINIFSFGIPTRVRKREWAEWAQRPPPVPPAHPDADQCIPPAPGGGTAPPSPSPSHTGTSTLPTPVEDAELLCQAENCSSRDTLWHLGAGCPARERAWEGYLNEELQIIAKLQLPPPAQASLQAILRNARTQAEPSDVRAYQEQLPGRLGVWPDSTAALLSSYKIPTPAIRQALNGVTDMLLPLWQEFTSSHDTEAMKATARHHERTGPRVVDRVKKLATRLGRHSFTTLCRAPVRQRDAESSAPQKRRRRATGRHSPTAPPDSTSQPGTMLDTAIALGSEAVRMRSAATRLERELASLRPALAELLSQGIVQIPNPPPTALADLTLGPFAQICPACCTSSARQPCTCTPPMQPLLRRVCDMCVDVFCTCCGGYYPDEARPAAPAAASAPCTPFWLVGGSVRKPQPACDTPVMHDASTPYSPSAFPEADAACNAAATCSRPHPLGPPPAPPLGPFAPVCPASSTSRTPRTCSSTPPMQPLLRRVCDMCVDVF
ncbi:MAG: hypothetical protein GY709_05245, partial [Herbaspirillum sp.]|nr:hypothetical protein [Herbaspirillum sp.]